MRITDSDRSRLSHLSADDVLDVLGDSVAREILAVGKGDIVTAEAIAGRCDVSEATVYRRLRELHNLGLIEKCAHIEAGAVSKGAYRTTVDNLTVRVMEGGITVEVGPSDKFADAVRTVRETVELDEVNYDPKRNSVQVAFTLDDERFRTFLSVYL